MSKTLIEETKALVIENKQPLGEIIPGSPFVLVALSYMAILSGGLLVAFSLSWLL